MSPAAVHPAYDYEPASIKGHPCPLLTSLHCTQEDLLEGQSTEIMSANSHLPTPALMLMLLQHSCLQPWSDLSRIAIPSATAIPGLWLLQGIQAWEEEVELQQDRLTPL